MLDSSLQQAITPQMVQRFAAIARKRMRIDGVGYRRDHLRAFAQPVEVAEREVFIKGSKDELIRTLVAIGSGKSAETGVPSFVPKWRRGWDSAPSVAALPRQPGPRWQARPFESLREARRRLAALSANSRVRE